MSITLGVNAPSGKPATTNHLKNIFFYETSSAFQLFVMFM